LSFRLAAAGDFPAVKRLHVRSSEGLAAHDLDARQLAAGAALTETPEYEADLARSNLKLAIGPSGEIVASAGWIAAADRPATGRIRKVYVDPAFARRGIASFLVRDAETRAGAAGCRHFVVRASRNAVPFYESLGYVALETGTMPAPGGVELPVVFMEKRR
jgi:putative acetyltransferase